MRLFRRVFLSYILLILLHGVIYSNEPSLIFVHIGDSIPAWTFTSLQQARYMNESCSIYLLANKESLQSIDTEVREELSHDRISLIDMEAIPITQEHFDFRNQNRLEDSLNGFWKYTTDRFFVIFDFLKHTQIKKVVHMENDTMLYVDLDEILPQLEHLDVHMAAPFQSMHCCIPCFVYIKDADCLKSLVDHITVETKNDHNCDMLTLASFFRKYEDEYMFTLPILMPDYPQYFKKRVSSFAPDNESSLEFLTRNAWAFPEYIFDAAAFGVYVNGNDKRYNPNTGPGQIHHRTLYDPSHFSYYWGKDEKGRACPYLTFKDRTYKIVNLHFHSKEVDGFTSYRNTRSEFPKRNL